MLIPSKTEFESDPHFLKRFTQTHALSHMTANAKELAQMLGLRSFLFSSPFVLQDKIWVWPEKKALEQKKQKIEHKADDLFRSGFTGQSTSTVHIMTQTPATSFKKPPQNKSMTICQNGWKLACKT